MGELIAYGVSDATLRRRTDEALGRKPNSIAEEGKDEMTPDERDRLVRLEEAMRQLASDVAEIRLVATKLDRQAQWVRGGLVLAVALGGLVSWLGDLWSNLSGK